MTKDTQEHLTSASNEMRGAGALAPSGVMAPYSLYHIDDCMYVAAASEDEARAYVKADCGNDCGESIAEVSLGFKVTTANVDDGEKATPDTMTTAGALIEDHLKHGGTLPYTVCFDAGM
jgi:hypothetical protein